MAFRASFAVALLGVTATLWAANAHAFRSYDNGSGTGYCAGCHLGFQGGNGTLHQRHRFNFGISDCTVCHQQAGGDGLAVLTYWSGAGYGCTGCHGRLYGETSPNSGQLKATAYGLRKLHTDNGYASNCGTSGCHKPGSLGHFDPFPPILPESVAPPYYDPAFSNLTNPCWTFEEDRVNVNSIGLDNDGDGSADYPFDSDCTVAPPSTTTTTPPPTTTTLPLDCGLAPVGGCIAPEKGVLLANEKAAGKEKLKVSFKKLLPALTQSQFGDPVIGTTGYAVCIYNDADQLSGKLMLERAGQLCGSLSCWLPVSTKGYKYTDKAVTTDGILKMLLTGGDPGKGKISVIGKNSASSLPLGIAAALQNSTRATVQILSSDAECFSATLNRVKKADGLIFSAVEP